MTNCLTRVSLAFIDKRVNNWLRFGLPVHETVIDRWRRTAHFPPDALFSRVCWLANDHGTTLWHLSVLQAGRPGEVVQQMAGVLPGALRLLHVSGEGKVQQVLQLVDAIEALDIDPAATAPTYWRTVHNRLAANQQLPVYTQDRHSAHLAAELLR